MTDFDICCLCASDEGVFLDIYTATGVQLGNRSFLKEFETCLSFKVQKNGALSSKICHKCAIELGECNLFIERYQQASSNLQSKTSKSVAKRSCCLCFTTAKNKYLFTLAKDFRSTTGCLQKLYECLKLQITREEAEAKVICLFCRYNLDVLYDLRKLAREVQPKLQIITKTKAIVENLPKTETFVVSRKTTAIRYPRLELHTPVHSDSEDGTMSRRQLRSKKLGNVTPAVESKPRICGQCEIVIRSGVDMYRLHKTGVTVCKMCWITMDPLQTTRSNKRKRNIQAESKSTKLCAVFLKDVLDTASCKEDGLLKVSKVEQDTDDVIYVISDDNSDEKKQSNNRKKRNLRRKWSGKTTKSDQEFDRKLKPVLKRPLKEEDAGSNGKSVKKLKSMKKTAVNVSPELRRSTRSHNSDSEIVIAKIKRRSNSAIEVPQSLEKSNNARSSNKLDKRKVAKNVPKAKDDVKWKSEDLSPTDDDGVGRRLRKVRPQVPMALKSKSTDSPQVEKSRKNVKPIKDSVDSKPPDSKSPVQKKSRVQSDVDKSPSTEIKASPKRSKTVMMVSFPFKLEDPYECKVCGTMYRNKTVGMTHELTHFKQVEVKIEKLNIAHHFQTVNDNAPAKEISQDSTNDGLTLDSSQTNEELRKTEVTVQADEKDDDDRSDDETPENECISTTNESESTQQNAPTPDVEDVKEPDAASSVEQLVAEESTSAINDSKDETTDRVMPALSLENEESSKEDVSPNNGTTEKQPEADLPIESNVDDVDNSAGKDASKTVEKDTVEESVEKPEETVGGVEDKTGLEQNDEDIDPPVVPSNTENISEAENRDLGEDIESDTDIRIVDTGSSAEDSSEQAEKKEENVQKAVDSSTLKDATETKDATNTEDATVVENATGVENVTAMKDVDIEPTDVKESTGASDDESQAITASKPGSVSESIAEIKSADVGAKSEEQPLDEDGGESPVNDRIDEFLNKTGNKINGVAEVNPTSTVTGILQEVIDLASAEVQKRAEREETAAETLEDITNEINKTSLEISGSKEIRTNERTDYDKVETDTTLSDLH